MKSKKIFAKLGSLIERIDPRDGKQQRAIETMLARLRKKDASIAGKLDGATSPSKKAKLKRKRKACRAHIKKGEAALRAAAGRKT